MLREIESQRLFTADADSARNLKRLYDHQIQAVIDVAASEMPAQLGRDLIYCRFPLHDDGSNPEELVAAAIETVLLCLRRSYRTLITCSAGISRSPVIAAASLAILNGDSFNETLYRVTHRGPHDVSPSLLGTVQRVHHQLVENTH